VNNKILDLKIILSIFIGICFIIAKPFVCNTGAYNIDVHIQDFNNNRIYLGHYYGSSYQLIDSAYTNQNGFAQFQSKASLKQGVYFVAIPPHTRFELMILDDQDFVVRTNLNNVMGDLVIEKLDYEDYFIPMQQEIAQLSLRQSNLDIQRQFFEYSGEKDSANAVKQELEMLKFERELIYKKYYDLAGDSFLRKMIKMMLQPDFIKEIMPLKYSKPGAYFAYYKNHYFDRVDFSDERILRTPEFVFERLLKEYCTYFVNTYQENPDSAYNNINSLLVKAEVNQEVFKFVLSYLSSYYSNPPYQGIEFVFVYLVDNYYLQNDYAWVDEKMLYTLKNEADEMRFNLVGNSAVNITLKTTEDEDIEINSYKSKYILLWFWEPDCYYCIDGINKILEVIDELKAYNLEIITVYVGSDKELWLQSIEEYENSFVNLYDPAQISNTYYGTSKTPRSFILNKNKVIIARDVAPQQMLSFMQYIESKN
jgi:peroxiredoxin